MIRNNYANANMAFKDIAMTENGVPYEKKKSGTITGGIISGISALSCGSILYTKNNLSKPDISRIIIDSVKELDAYKGKAESEIIGDLQKKYKKAAIIWGVIAAASLATGIFIDKYRNNKAKAEAEQLALQYQQQFFA